MVMMDCIDPDLTHMDYKKERLSQEKEGGGGGGEGREEQKQWIVSRPVG